MRISTSRLTIYSFLTFFFSMLVYYLFHVFLQKQSSKFCDEHYCLEILSLGDFISILVAVLGLVFVVHSLDSWKNQDAYYNSRDIIIELSEYIYTCSTDIIIKIINLPENLSSEEKLDEIKKIIPNYGIGSPISNLIHKINYENIYYKEEFIKISSILQNVIIKMWNVVDGELNDLKNIDSRINIVTRNELNEANKLKEKLHDKLCDLTK